MSWLIKKLQNSFHPENNSLCLHICGKDYTYAEITHLTAAIQNILVKNTSGDIVGIVATDSPETYASILACWFSGKGFVPVHPKYPADRNNNIIEQANIDLILSSVIKCDGFISTSKVHIVNSENTPKQDNKISICHCAKEQILCILFTSGSTGQPKGVPMTLKNIECTLDSFFSLRYNHRSSDRYLQMFELTFDMSMLSYLPAFIIGASIYTVGSDKIKYLEALKIMLEHKITFAAMVPSTLSLLRPYFPKIFLPELKYSLLGGEPFFFDLAEEWSKCTPHAILVNISGPTEITMACMGYELNKDFSKNKAHNGILGFGYSWKNTTAIVVDDNLSAAETGKTGELCFSGDHVMSGYLNQPELNKAVFFEKEINGKLMRFYRSGDMAFVDETGFFYTCGRKDLQVKIQGHKVELEEIEYVAKKILKNNNIIALTTLNTFGSHEINMVIEAKTIDEKEIIDKLYQKLPPYMMPSRIKAVDNFVYNTNGKIDRIAFNKLFV
jgi:amino acid adenylation domain-containing protein